MYVTTEEWHICQHPGRVISVAASIFKQCAHKQIKYIVDHYWSPVSVHNELRYAWTDCTSHASVTSAASLQEFKGSVILTMWVSLIVYLPECQSECQIFRVSHQCNRSVCMHIVWHWSSNWAGLKQPLCFCRVHNLRNSDETTSYTFSLLCRTADLQIFCYYTYGSMYQ